MAKFHQKDIAEHCCITQFSQDIDSYTIRYGSRETLLWPFIKGACRMRERLFTRARVTVQEAMVLNWKEVDLDWM